MLARLEAFGRAAAERLRRRAIARLGATQAPAGVTVETNDAGVTLMGRRLRMRLIETATLRTFGR